MKHKYKMWFSPVVVSCISCVSFCTTSCKSQDGPYEPPITPTDQEYLSFIDDRSFSIAAWSNGNWVRGTGWIINKADTTLNNYSYWMATNWHVIDGFDNLTGAPQYRYADHSTDIHGFDSYAPFTSFTQEDWGNFTINNDKSNAIDFYVAKVNFGSPQPRYKTKLDNLNSYWSTHSQRINTFVQDYQPTSSTNKKYIAGYPVGSNSYASWEEHVIIDSSNISWPHEATEDKTVIDTSPQYRFSQKTTAWMSGGASGSMILDTNKSICGIYWGGWGMEQSDIFYPCASIFNSSIKNYISPYW